MIDDDGSTTTTVEPPSIQEQLVYLEKISNSRRQIALERIRTKGDFSRMCVELLDRVVGEWEEADNTTTTPIHLLLAQTLNLLLHILSLDRTLEEELSIDGGHRIVTRLIQNVVPTLDSTTTTTTSSSSMTHEDEQDAREDLRDAIFSIASCFRRSSYRTTMFTTEERIQRLPLVFDVGNASLTNLVRSKTTTIEQSTLLLFHQVPLRQSSQADVGMYL